MPSFDLFYTPLKVSSSTLFYSVISVRIANFCFFLSLALVLALWKGQTSSDLKFSLLRLVLSLSVLSGVLVQMSKTDFSLFVLGWDVASHYGRGEIK